MSLTGIGEVADAVSGIVNKIWPDKTPVELAQIQAQLTVELAQTNLVASQLQVDDDEAKSSSWWVAGARPAFIWIAAGIFGYHYLFQPLLAAISAFFHGPLLPDLPLDSVYTEVTTGLLGIHVFGEITKHAVRKGALSLNVGGGS